MSVQVISRIEAVKQPPMKETHDTRHLDPQNRLSVFERTLYGNCTGFDGQPRLLRSSSSNENYICDERVVTHGFAASRITTSGYIARGRSPAGSRSHALTVLTVVLAGQAEVRWKRETTRLNQGDIYLNTAANYHMTCGAGTYQRIIFPESLISGLDVVRDDFVFLRRNDAVTKPILAAIECGAASLESGDEERIQLAAHLAASISQAILQDANRASQRYGYSHLRDRAVDYINDNLHRAELSIAEIANYLHISRATLYRAFETVGGLKEFITRERIERAKLKLRAGLTNRGSVTSVAYDAGFSSPEHFSKVFKAKTGMTPTQYIKSGLA